MPDNSQESPREPEIEEYLLIGSLYYLSLLVYFKGNVVDFSCGLARDSALLRFAFDSDSLEEDDNEDDGDDGDDDECENERRRRG